MQTEDSRDHADTTDESRPARTSERRGSPRPNPQREQRSIGKGTMVRTALHAHRAAGAGIRGRRTSGAGPIGRRREALTGLDGRDIGIDLVAKRTTGEWIAIQCKCYDESHILSKTEIDKFLGGSQQAIFRLRWAVATCRWGPNAQRAILNAQPPVTQVDFNQYLAVQVEEETAERPIQQPWPLQEDAIEDTVAGLGNHDRGRLVMACGTGKTFTSLRIAQDVVDNGGRILFAAPTIALVSQARREWLRQTTRPLKCIVVCSDSTAGGRNENEDMRVSELECPVTTNPCGDRTGPLG